jgi:hypothetical protein
MSDIQTVRAIPMNDRRCVVEVVNYGTVDVVALYRENGFATLPPQLTISGWNLMARTQVPTSYTLHRYERDERFHPEHAIAVRDGDRFIAVPPAYGGH